MEQLNIPIIQIGQQQTQAAMAPNNTLELLSILLNGQLYDYDTENGLEQALSEWLLEQPKELFFELFAHKRSEMKEFITYHLKHHKHEYLTPFSKELLEQNELVFCIPSKLPKAAFIKQQLEKYGVKTSGTITKKTSHALLNPGMKYKENVIYTEYEALLDYLSQNNRELVPSPFNETETNKIIELLCSINLASIDLGLQMVKNLETIEKTFVSPLLAAYFMKKKSKSRFKTGTGWPLLKRVLEEYGTESFMKKVKKEDYIAQIIKSSIYAGFDIGPLIDVLMAHKETRKYELRSLSSGHGLPFNKYYLPHFMRNLEAFKDHQNTHKDDRYYYISQLNVHGEDLENEDLVTFMEALEIETIMLGNGNDHWKRYLEKVGSEKLEDMEMYNVLENPNISKDINFSKKSLSQPTLKLEKFGMYLKTKKELEELVLPSSIEILTLTLGEEGDYSKALHSFLSHFKNLRTLELVSPNNVGVKLNIQQMLEGIELENLTLHYISLINVQPIKKSLKTFFGQIVSPDYLQAARYIQGLAKLNQLILENEEKNK